MIQVDFDFIKTVDKCCLTCKETKGLDNFYKKPSNKDRRFNVCKDCYSHRENLKNRLKSGFASLKTDHCECCYQTSVKLDLDHCHDTGMFRGFICRPCNKTLAVNGDNYKGVKDSDLGLKYLKYMKQANHRMGKVCK